MNLRDWTQTAAFVTTLLGTTGLFSTTSAYAAEPNATQQQEDQPQATPSPAAAPAPTTHLALGLGALAMPSHPGSARTRILPLPYVDAHAGPLYVSALRGVGLELSSPSGAFYGGTSVYLDFGRQESSDPDRLRGRGDIGMAIDPRLYAGFRMPLARTTLARVEASAHRHIGGSNAILADATVGVSTRLPSIRTSLDASLSTTWMDARYARTFFDADQSGIRDVTLTMSGAYSLTDHWSLGAMARGGILVGNAASSPVVATRFQPSTLAFVRYEF